VVDGVTIVDSDEDAEEQEEQEQEGVPDGEVPRAGWNIHHMGLTPAFNPNLKTSV